MKKIKAKNISGSRVPMSVLFDYIIEGHTLHDFISAYPWIKKASVEKALKEFKGNEYPQSHAF